MTEAQLQQGIIDAARRLGYLVYHAHFARNSETGFPDLIIVGHNAVFAWELKTEKGRVRKASVTKRGRVLPGQDDWIREFSAAGVNAGIIRPANYDTALRTLQDTAVEVAR